MVAGMERYFQIARCFRDEDLRADRQPEFTQLDIEMSFVDAEDIMEMMEGLMAYVFEGAMGKIQLPMQRLTWDEAMDRFGSDKPDLRFGMELVNMSEAAKEPAEGRMKVYSVFSKVVFPAPFRPTRPWYFSPIPSISRSLSVQEILFLYSTCRFRIVSI